MPQGQGKNILIVEDEFLIAIHAAEVMEGLGFCVVGPVATIEQALELLREGAFDGAILDVNLSGTLVFPVAEALVDRGIPFILTSGYEATGLPERWRDRPHLRKPVIERDLARLAGHVFTADTAMVAANA
ncbi:MULTISPECIES: response regulator [Azospirillaceae]|uniref:response regulator n=1 Tax=Azospirillaceae TaxID=2829815 RepID=UPI000B66B9ED|nr:MULTISPECIES: response regulator [Azospirillaceae]MDG5493656.1 response regulator [Niveispirillum sp. BGYR6]SNS16939.1 CheY chemotaxis protein or a CheY-like REC (receiver) domain [Azospirillum sp. RU38E]SNS34228.1 CheY chemotaxis protein or a CheY-like REC (receiver) domain [Azospirillum sp. RU37A]